MKRTFLIILSLATAAIALKCWKGKVINVKSHAETKVQKEVVNCLEGYTHCMK